MIDLKVRVSESSIATLSAPTECLDLLIDDVEALRGCRTTLSSTGSFETRLGIRRVTLAGFAVVLHVIARQAHEPPARCRIRSCLGRRHTSLLYVFGARVEVVTKPAGADSRSAAGLAPILMLSLIGVEAEMIKVSLIERACY